MITDDDLYELDSDDLVNLVERWQKMQPSAYVEILIGDWNGSIFKQFRPDELISTMKILKG